jgi:hypothetical protein
MVLGLRVHHCAGCELRSGPFSFPMECEMPQSLEYTNSFGDRRISTIRAEFSDADGRRFFVIGPVPLGTYEVRPPYDILEYNSDEMVVNY